MLAVLVLDSVNLARVDRLVAEDRLPAFAALRERGRWYDLEHELGYFGSWQSLYTGVGPAEHGLANPFVWSASEQRLRFMDAFQAPEAIWEAVGRHGLRSLVLDPYEAPAPGRMEGLFLKGIQFKNAVVLPRAAMPRGADRPLRRKLGRPPVAEEVAGAQSASWLLTLRERLLAAPARAADAVIDQLGRDTFDLLWMSFSAGHAAAHQFWDLSQVADPGPERARTLLSTVDDVYVAQDRAMSRVLAALPDGTDVIVLAVTGMGPNTSRVDLLPEMLQAVLGGGRPVSPSRSRVWRIRAGLPTRVRVALTAALPEQLALELICRRYYPGVDWSQTRAFVVPGDFDGYVRFNVRGRERDGIVDPADVDELATAVTDGLLSFSEPGGEQTIARVERVHEQLSGSRLACLPDLLVCWGDRPSSGLTQVSSPRYGTVLRRFPTGRSGNHADGAWAIVAPARSRHREPTRPARVTDLAGTVFSALGLDTDVPGERLLEPA